jgi:hypothetical protein
MLIREIIKRIRHDGCGGRAGKVEMMTDIAPFCEPSPDGWDVVAVSITPSAAAVPREDRPAMKALLRAVVRLEIDTVAGETRK